MRTQLLNNSLPDLIWSVERSKANLWCRVWWRRKTAYHYNPQESKKKSSHIQKLPQRERSTATRRDPPRDQFTSHDPSSLLSGILKDIILNKYDNFKSNRNLNPNWNTSLSPLTLWCRGAEFDVSLNRECRRIERERKRQDDKSTLAAPQLN
jgi:hypothetical protein